MKRSMRLLAECLFVILYVLYTAPALSQAKTLTVPGVVIDHSPASSGLYIGSPSLAVLPNGDYVASHDLFGPKSLEFECPKTRVFRSADRGETWTQVATIDCAFWSNLFTNRGALYLMGTDKHHGHIVIRRSLDGGETWTTPRDSTTGLLTPESEYHTAPMPVVEHRGRLWRAFEGAMGGTKWGERYQAGMLSAPADADLLNATSWTFSNFLPRDPNWLNGNFRAWLEGNAVRTRDGHIVNVLRVDTPGCPEKAAIVNISEDGKTASFDPASGFIDFSGGAKKFTIRYDEASSRYWSLATIVPDRHRAAGRPGGIRNTLALVSSQDLRAWETRCILLYHPDVAKHGFQYPDWQFDGNDLIAAVRTAFDDGQGGAHNNHDANFLTFHRFRDFRSLTMADSVPMPELTGVRHEAPDLVLTGTGFEMARFDNGEKAFSNRAYIWRDVPPFLAGAQVTRTAGGERAQLTVRAKRPVTVYAASTAAQAASAFRGWKDTGASFYYTDGGRTRMSVFSRKLDAGEELAIPQGNWTGGLIILPAQTAGSH